MTLIPEEGLPRGSEQPIDVAGASWDAFVFYSYSAIGRVIAAGDDLMPRREVLIVPTGGRRVLAFVDAFMAARQVGAGAGQFLTSSAERQWAGFGVAPLYQDEEGQPYLSFKVLFLYSDGPSFGDLWTVGVRLASRGGIATDETLGIRVPASGAPIIAGMRPGSTGP